MKRNEQRDIRLLESILPRVWGTIGPDFVKANTAVAKLCGTEYGLTVFSNTAALEAILRGWNIGFGDEVIIADYSDPVNTSVTAAVFATPVFADVCPECFALTRDTVLPRITPRTKAVIADLPCGRTCGIKSLSDLCKEKGIKLILNMNDALCAKVDSVPAARLADAAFVNLSDGKSLDAGLAGAVLTDCRESFDLFYAYHNCGRPFGEGATLSFDAIIGGDLRIAEWQAALINAYCEDGEAFETTENNLSLRFRLMHVQPFLKSDYFRKLTGNTPDYSDGDFPNSVAAAQKA